MTDKFIRVIFFAIMFSLFASCGFNTEELTSEEKYAVDTIFNNQLNNYRNYLDSTCLANKDTLYSRTVDSLKQEGMKEIEMLLMKNHLAE